MLDGLPIVHLSKDAEVMDSLISMLYPIPSKIPYISKKILALLTTATKYDMDVVQSFIHAEVSHRSLLSPPHAGSFCVYAVAYSQGLVPEMVAMAHHTLGSPLTFESLDDALQLFKGQALCDLADFCLHNMDSFSSNLKLFSSYLKGPSKIWVGCPMAHWQVGKSAHCLPTWLDFLHIGPI
jgi:hypothetical protein